MYSSSSTCAVYSCEDITEQMFYLLLYCSTPGVVILRILLLFIVKFRLHHVMKCYQTFAFIHSSYVKRPDIARSKRLLHTAIFELCTYEQVVIARCTVPTNDKEEIHC